MGKFDFSKTIEAVKKSYKQDTRMANQIGLGTSLEDVSKNPEDYVILDPWWEEKFGVMGLKFGHIIQVAGKSDSGKTSICLLAMRKAQEQGYGIVYVETEGKTGPADLLDAGIDPNQVICVHSKITEEAFELGLKAWDSFFANYPTEKLLFIYDSYGNTVSMRDAGIIMTQTDSQPGGAGKINRLGINSMQAKMITDPVACLFINRTYNNIGGKGKTNAGGEALDFFSMLTLQTARKGWYEKTIGKEKVRAGADVIWTVFKNHYSKSLKDSEGKPVLLPKKVTLRITAEGMRPLSGAEEAKPGEDGDPSAEQA